MSRKDAGREINDKVQQGGQVRESSLFDRTGSGTPLLQREADKNEETETGKKPEWSAVADRYFPATWSSACSVGGRRLDLLASATFLRRTGLDWETRFVRLSFMSPRNRLLILWLQACVWFRGRRTQCITTNLCLPSSSTLSSRRDVVYPGRV